MVYHQCGFFHASSNYLFLSICSHTRSSWMVCPQCALFHVSSNQLIVCICTHTWSSWMVFHQCGFFHGSSNCLFVLMFSHNSRKGILWQHFWNPAILILISWLSNKLTQKLWCSKFWDLFDQSFDFDSLSTWSSTWTSVDWWKKIQWKNQTVVCHRS